MAENRPINTDNHEILWSQWVSQRASPLKQFVFTAFFSGISIVGLFWAKGGIESLWFLAFVGLFFYVWLNCMIGFFRRVGAIVYTIWSWILFLVLAVVLIGIASRLSTISINDLPEYRTMFTANIVFYFLLTFLVAIMREVAKITGIEY